MNPKRHVTGGIFLFLLAVLFILAGCSGGSSSSPDLSNITELSAESKGITATQGGTITHNEFTANFPAAALPADAQIKVSKVSVSISDDIEDDDPALMDMTGTYVLSTTSSDQTVELATSASIAFKVNPAGFDTASIRLVVWSGYEWEEVPAAYDETSHVLSSTADAILPFGNRIYLANPEKSSTSRPEDGEQIVSEFLAMKVVGETSANAAAQSIASKSFAPLSTAVKPGRAVYINSKSGKFTVNYTQVADPVEAETLKNKAEEVAGYMDNAYNTIVTGMGLKEPAISPQIGYSGTWPVKLRVLGNYHGSADAEKYQIYLNIKDSSGDGLAHTCHHEFTHLVQFKTLKDANNKIADSLDWFGETMADGVGFYAQQGRGTIYSLADTDMGHFDVRLDADYHTMGENNDNYEYKHFPFISYLLAVYKETKFKNFFETWYSYKPGSTQISMNTIDKAATSGLGKDISGRNGIFWDFYRDYFISGLVFNKDKFKNLPDRDSGKPFDIKESDKKMQGVTIVEVVSTTSDQKNFTMQRLAGQVLIYRFKGSTDNPMDLKVTVNSTPGTSVGRIQVIAFKRETGILQQVGTAEDVADGSQKQLTYTGFGKDTSEIYILMVNTSFNTDSYAISVSASAATQEE